MPRQSFALVLPRLWRYVRLRATYPSRTEGFSVGVASLQKIYKCRELSGQHYIKLATFARRTGLTLELIYYPPYHSKYNPVERCWAALEQFWDGAILDSIETTLEWTSRMMWKGFEPIVYYLAGTDEKGVNVDPEALAEFRLGYRYVQNSSRLIAATSFCTS